MKLLDEVGGELEAMGLEMQAEPRVDDEGESAVVVAKGPRAKRRRVVEDEAEDDEESMVVAESEDGAGRRPYSGCCSA